ncbi:unnamed protein product [Acanthoscelides obtectus]|uniref:Uncharacterized protein n=1 Tax=Acanthoscelides obtectus TaxID=200917 RepID=A0A9P0PM45_ACAOB|nr:unnamed protein product [Acanthoscelides obtectus]CAK1640541.1 hypothetical protein AOBTE_LOCUS11785 [Acanthoscelides obtectus]
MIKTDDKTSQRSLHNIVINVLFVTSIPATLYILYLTDIRNTRKCLTSERLSLVDWK